MKFLSVFGFKFNFYQSENRRGMSMKHIDIDDILDALEGYLHDVAVFFCKDCNREFYTWFNEVTCCPYCGSCNIEPLSERDVVLLDFGWVIKLRR